jgi:tRNA pseudouridine32 synthase/23S rRNA pseudouridine746 synthase/23S rRNA pseudouridine1911/1915/1917 synthase
MQNRLIRQFVLEKNFHLQQNTAMKFTATEESNLFDFLIKSFPSSSRNTLRSWIKEGRVLIDGIPIKNLSAQLLEGQNVVIGQRKKLLPCGIEILYDDQDLVVINKPSGLLSVSAAFEQGETAHAWLRAYYLPKRIYVVHRLDQDTSGVMMFALNRETCEALKEQFEKHSIERAYTAVVEGNVVKKGGTWQSYQYEDKQYVVHETEDESFGRLAITHFKTKASSRRYSLLELTLETGRKNQIRVHCQSVGHPVAGDRKYGARTNPIKRLCLHAHLLAFKHPTKKKLLRFESPPPAEFLRLVSTQTAPKK